jgi:hypothetical protein
MPNNHSKQSIFSDFTNLYALTKTLRFELKPTEVTKSHLNFDKDEERARYYKEIKILFDQLHRKFIADSLTYYSQQSISYQEIWEKYNLFLEAKKNRKKDDPKSKKVFDDAKKDFEKTKENYRKKIVEIFNQFGEQWKYEINQEITEKYPDKYTKIDKKTGQIKGCLSDKGIKVLTEAGILEVLKLYLGQDIFREDRDTPFSRERKEELLAGIKFFDKFFTYFGSFNQTRENFYKSDGTATAIPTRIIDENLIRFFDNIILANSKIKFGENELKPIEAEIDFDKSIFEINSFNSFVTQTGIDIYNGGKDGDTKLGQFKTNLNLYAQSHFGKSKKLTWKNLYKLMLSEKAALFEEETPESCIQILNEVKDKNQAHLGNVKKVFDFVFDNSENDQILEKIYLKKESINDLSVYFFGGSNWFILQETIKNLGNGKTEKGEIKLDTFIPVLTLKQALLALADGSYQSLRIKKKSKSKKTAEDSLFTENKKGYFAEDLFKPEFLTEKNKNSSSLWALFVKLWEQKLEREMLENQRFVEICETEIFNLEKYEPLKPTNYNHTFTFKGEEKTKLQTQANLAKLFLDSCMSLWQGVKMFELVKNKKSVYEDFEDHENNTNLEFYETIKEYFEDFVLFKYYDKIRNFSTKKPFSTSKFKINFENASLLGGWDLNKETDNTSVILKTPAGYDLIVMNKKHNKTFDKIKNPDLYKTNSDEFLKMEYKLLPGPNKMLPKVAFAASNRELFINVFDNYPNIEIIRKEETFKKEKLVKSDLTTWINFYQDILNTYPDWKNFGWSFKSAQDYQDVSEFYRDVQVQGYKLKLLPINNNLLQEYEQTGKIYRFQIKNKDWNEFSKGRKNLQTIYWEYLFDPQNLEKNIIKLNGEAEIFQRPKSHNLEKKQKVDKSGKPIFKGKTNQKVLENERYLENQLFFHCPITINFSAKETGRYKDLIELVNNLGKESLNYLGIDRGENHLLYYSLVNSKGEIIEKTFDGRPGQGSLNELGAVDPQTGKPKDYERLLNTKQENKKDAQDKWSVIGNIKELKSGYLSLAIHEICKLAFENKALIILENLNYGFKKSRTIKFEKSVYQKFEVALAKKLQHLFFKDKDPFEIGGVLNAVQLTPKLEKITDIDNKDQWGIVQYVPASYTSRICPLTGWHKTIYLKDNVSEIQKAFNPDGDNPIMIKWSQEYKCYTFSYQTDIEIKGNENSNPGYCTLYLLPEIIRTTYRDRSLQTTKAGELSEGLANLLAPFLEGTDKNNINQIIWERFEDKNWKKLKCYFDQLCNIRVKVNSENEKLDVIQSPIAYEFQGEKIFFDSRKEFRKETERKLGRVLPIDGDANGAYNIAKRGLEVIAK